MVQPDAHCVRTTLHRDRVQLYVSAQGIEGSTVRSIGWVDEMGLCSNTPQFLSPQRRLQAFLAAPVLQAEEHFQYFLEYVTPCLTGFFGACCQTTLHAFLDDKCLALAQQVAEGIVMVAQQCPHMSRGRVQNVAAFSRIITEVLDDVDLDDISFSGDDDDDDRGSTVSSALSIAAGPSNLMVAMHSLQMQSLEEFPADTMDHADQFDLRLIGIDEDGALDGKLLKKLMAQITDRVLSASVKVCRGLQHWASRHMQQSGMCPPTPVSEGCSSVRVTEESLKQG